MLACRSADFLVNNMIYRCIIRMDEKSKQKLSKLKYYGRFMQLSMCLYSEMTYKIDETSTIRRF